MESVTIDTLNDKLTRVELRCGGLRVATSAKSVPENEEELKIFLREILAILEAPEEEDKEFF